MDRTTYTPPTDDENNALDSESIGLLRVADEILTANQRTVASAMLFAKGALAMAPAGVADIPGVSEWLTRTMHSTYMTGRASGTAQLLDTDIVSLMRNVAEVIPEGYAAKIVAQSGWNKPTDFAAQLKALNPAQRVFLDMLADGPTLQAQEIAAPAEDKTAYQTEADACFAMVERVIAQHPDAKISLADMPAGVESRLKAKYPADKFVSLTPEMLSAMNEAKGATRN